MITDNNWKRIGIDQLFYLLVLVLPALAGGNYLFNISPVTGVFILHLVILFLVLFWSLKSIRIGSPIIPSGYISVPVLSFVLVNIVSLYYSVNPFNGHLKILILLNGIVFYIFAQSICNDKKNLINIIKIIVLSGMLISMYGIYQEYFGFSMAVREAMESSLPNHIISNIKSQVRIFSTFQNVNAFAGYLIIVVPLCLYLSIFSEEKITRIWSKITLLLLLLGLILTFSKGGWLTFFIISMAILVYLVNNKIKRGSFIVVPFVFSIVILLFFIIKGIFGNTAFLPNISFNIIDSLKDRLEYWRMTSKIIIDNPITGTGLGGYASMAQRYQIGSVYSRYAHNNYLQIFAETGIFGFITYIWVALDIFTKGVSIIREDRSRRNEAFFLLIATAAFLTHSLIDFDWETPAIQITYFLLAGIIIRMKKINDTVIKEKEMTRDSRPSYKRWPAYMIVTLLIAASLISILSPFVSDGYFHVAKQAFDDGRIDDALDLGRGAVLFAPHSGGYHNLLAVILRRKGETTKDLSWYHLSISESEKAIGYEPVTAYYHNEKAKTLWALGNSIDSVAEFIKAKDLYPADISLRNDLGRVMITMKRYNNAIEELEEALLMGNDYLNRQHADSIYLFETYLLLGEAYREKGETDRSLQAYREVIRLLSTIPLITDRKGDLIDKNLIGAEAHLRTGEIYQLKDDKDLAIQEFKMAFEMNRSLKDIPVRIKELEGE